MRPTSSVFPTAARRAGALLALLLLAAGVAAQEKRWGPTPAVSEYGHRHDELFQLITILVSASFLIVLGLLLLPMLKHRGPKHKAHFDHGSSLHDKRFTAIVSVVVFLGLDASVLWVAMSDLREGYWNIPLAADTPDLLPVEVLGQQWAWNFRQPGGDGAFGTQDDILSLNELTVPKDRPVALNLTSKDVIHSFFLPDMRMKRDANPGAVNVAWFKPTQAGTFDILCAELCGYAHYQMHGKLHVLEADDYAAWEADASRLAAAAFDPSDTEAHWAWEWKE